MRDLTTERPRRSTEITLTRVSEGAVVQAPGGPELLLNPTALALWELCDGQTAVAEMVAAVCLLFDIDEDAASRDVTAALHGMLDSGVLVA